MTAQFAPWIATGPIRQQVCTVARWHVMRGVWIKGQVCLNRLARVQPTYEQRPNGLCTTGRSGGEQAREIGDAAIRTCVNHNATCQTSLRTRPKAPPHAITVGPVDSPSGTVCLRDSACSLQCCQTSRGWLCSVIESTCNTGGSKT